MLDFYRSVDFSSFFFNFNFKPIIMYSIFMTLFVFPTVLFPFSLSLTYINLLYLPPFNFAYLFFLFFLTFSLKYFLVLFSLLYSPIGILHQFCFIVCALISFVLVDITFVFLCLLGQFIVLYFCQTALISIMDVYVYVYIQ